LTLSSLFLLQRESGFSATHRQLLLLFFENQVSSSSQAGSHSPQVAGQASRAPSLPSQRDVFSAIHAQPRPSLPS
jgi:hypothetical protein